MTDVASIILSLFHWTCLFWFFFFWFFYSLCCKRSPCLWLLTVSDYQCSKGSWAGLNSSRCLLSWVWFRGTKSVFISNSLGLRCERKLPVFLFYLYNGTPLFFVDQTNLFCFHLLLINDWHLAYIMIQYFWTHDIF